MLAVHEIICIQCPLACRIKLSLDDKGQILEITDNQCKMGKAYAEQEYTSPKRVLTATVKTENSVRPLLPVRTNQPVAKDKLGDCMVVLSGVRVRPALHIGDVVVHNILGTGADVVSTDDLPI